MSMFFEVQLKYSAYGQVMVNKYWYRSLIESIPLVDLLPFDMASVLAQSVRDRIWLAMKPMVTTAVTLEEIVVYPLNDLFELVYQLPYVRTFGDEHGDASETVGAPPENTINFRYNMKPKVADNPLYPAPKKGMVAVSPVGEGYFAPNGNITENSDTANFASALNLFISPILPFVGPENLGQYIPDFGVPLFQPMRIKEYYIPPVRNPLNGDIITPKVHLAYSWAEIQSVVVSRHMGKRLSRRAE